MNTRREDVGASVVCVGDRYVGHGKTWCVVDLRGGTVGLVNVDDAANTLRVPVGLLRDWAPGVDPDAAWRAYLDDSALDEL